MIRAKLRAESVVNYESTVNGEKSSEQICLRAVYSSDPNSENYAWSKFTPNAELTMTITNPSAWGHFEVGKEYYLDITQVEV